jgi:hypothetical protein
LRKLKRGGKGESLDAVGGNDGRERLDTNRKP